MSDYYQQYLSSVAGTGESPNQNPQDAQYQPQQHSAHMGNISPPLATPYQNLGYFTGFPDPIMFQAPKAQNNRNRKKSTSGTDHVKHRRTRSGCYTCRSRRVKCDETHPICERCRKGKRDCVYPEPSSGKGQASGSGSSKDAAGLTQEPSPNSSQDEADEEIERNLKLEPILDEDESAEALSPSSYSVTDLRRTSTTSTQHTQRTMTRQSSETPSQEGTKSASPAVSTGTSASFTISFQVPDPALQSAVPGLDWSHLPTELQSHLRYFVDNITHYNYGMVNDSDNFFRSILPSLAVQPGNEALLNAVVGFSAYHRTVKDPNGKIQDFLRYYNKSVTFLLSCLKRREKQSTATLLTILQLATIEEYLGDWVNLMGHQKAAHEILTRLFTPHTILASPTSRILLTWYIRFDVFVGMMGGFETNLPRQWFSTVVRFCKEQVEQDPQNLGMKTELHASALRLISRDMSILYAKGGRGELSGEEFAAEHSQITTRLYEWRSKLDPALTDPNFLVTDFKHKVPLTEDDIIDPYKPGYLYENPLFTTTELMAEWHSILVMHKSQEAFALQQKPSDELRGLAFAICEIFEAVELWPSAPSGALVPIQACLAIAALFLPRDQAHHMWLRRKYAMLESLGYVFPLTIRARMAEIFRDPSCIQWWLPNDEGLSSILRSIRAFADERNANPVSQQTESLREISAIFAKMRLDHEHEAEPSPGESNSGASSF
ncbi:fungal-specific transcription factor domain-containing protein [Hypoxylon trugodes]|uniref:fungal-specific transcription factor domain-containing protein n=1 Tax=Hypoxylon trugodes TaxID=326681 RepID=UPI002197CB9B|nr:fungal-specific transcription factor domain-containing protein [Hypoxylon trugodes]KAI1386348.1 fungal-specific transcription factor domain-containing protein [Hypoxylon trugodes]